MTSTEYVVSERPFVVRRRVKWGDCDPAGVVYTVTFGEYVLSAAELFYGYLFDGTPQRIKDEHGFGTPTRALSFDFQASLWPDEEFDMRVTVHEVRTRTYTLHIHGSARARFRRRPDADLRGPRAARDRGAGRAAHAAAVLPGSLRAGANQRER